MINKREMIVQVYYQFQCVLREMVAQVNYQLFQARSSRRESFIS